MEGLDFFPPGLSVNILISVDKKVLVFRKPQGLNSGYWEWEERAIGDLTLVVIKTHT